MMKIVLIREASVKLPAGTVVEVNEREAERLRAFGLGKEAPAPVRKQTKKEK